MSISHDGGSTDIHFVDGQTEKRSFQGSIRPSGQRKLTPKTHASTQIASNWGDETAVPKKRAVLAFNRAAKLLGLSSQAIELMNKLFSFSLDRDWHARTRPLVWPDNERLLAQLSYSLATIKRCLRQLCESGMISFKDSPNGKRYGKRNGDQQIILTSTFGIDLSPVGVRAAELEDLADQDGLIQYELRLLSRRWTCERRKLTNILEAAYTFDLEGPWNECAADLERLMEMRRGRCSVERLRDLCDAASAVLERATTAFSAATEKFKAPKASNNEVNNRKSSNLSPKGVISEPHIQNTKQNLDRSLYNKRRSAEAEQNHNSRAGFASGKRALKNYGGADSDAQHENGREDEASLDRDLDLVLDACPEIAEWSSSRPRSWQDLRKLANQLRPLIGISPDAWNNALAELGECHSAVALAIIYQKYAANEIREPGGYLRAMTERHRVGQLRLMQSIRSLLAAQISASLSASTQFTAASRSGRLL